MKNRHALVDIKTGLVRSVIIWEGHPFVPPADHYLIHDCDGQPGDYWHQDTNTFYTPNRKRRVRDTVINKVGEAELTQQEKDTVEQRINDIYDHATRVLNMPFSPDLTLGSSEIPKE
jgi:hypothetical protein